jgi:gamma-glutamylcysteine synthetase
MSDSDKNNIDDLAELQYRQVKVRQRNRDQVFRWTRMKVMENTCTDMNNWLTEECKDLIILMDIFKVKGNPNLKADMLECEKRILEIQRTFPHQIIAPMKKIAKGSSEAKNEEEYARKFRVALDNAFGVALELRKIREKTDTAYRGVS